MPPKSQNCVGTGVLVSDFLLVQIYMYQSRFGVPEITVAV
jgi:hypothetical protein